MHVLVHKRVLRNNYKLQLAHENRFVQVPELRWITYANPNSDPDANSYANTDANAHSDSDTYSDANAGTGCAE